MAKKIVIDIDLLIEKYDELYSLRETAKYFGCSVPVIHNMLRANNVSTKKTARLTPERLKQLSDAGKKGIRAGNLASPGKLHRNWKGGISAKAKYNCCICNKEVERYPHNISNVVVCKECYPTHMSNLFKGDKSYMWLGDKLNRTCPTCGKEFRARSMETIYCSNECWAISNSGEGNYNWQGGSIKEQCFICGKDILVTRYKHKISKTKKFNCYSKECRSKFFSYLASKGITGVPSGELHPNWRGGTSREPYPFEWMEELKDRIRERDSHVCQICFQEERLDNMRLSVHHINYNKKDIDDGNLISLCAKCHGATNYNRGYWEPILSDKIKSRMLGRAIA